MLYCGKLNGGRESHTRGLETARPWTNRQVLGGPTQGLGLGYCVDLMSRVSVCLLYF